MFYLNATDFTHCIFCYKLLIRTSSMISCPSCKTEHAFGFYHKNNIIVTFDIYKDHYQLFIIKYPERNDYYYNQTYQDPISFNFETTKDPPIITLQEIENRTIKINKMKYFL